MKFFFVLFLLVVEQVCGKYNTKIVGGHRTKIESYRYLVAIVTSRTKHDGRDCLCGGTIVTPRWILTAAHCCIIQGHEQYRTGMLSIIAGSTNCYNVTGNYQKIPIINFVVHPMFSMEDGANGGYHTYNDIGLMLLKTQIKKELARPVQLATPTWIRSWSPKDFVHDCVAMGWGVQIYGELMTPPQLFAVKLPLLDIKKCHTIYNKYYDRIPLPFPLKFDTTKTICTMQPGGGKDVCTGDSGGPLICNNHQIGIVSMGYDCAQPGVPNIWTRVDQFHRWILKVTSNTKAKSRSKALRMSNILVFILGMLSK